jgi:hypothetical protein
MLDRHLAELELCAGDEPALAGGLVQEQLLLLDDGAVRGDLDRGLAAEELLVLDDPGGLEARGARADLPVLLLALAFVLRSAFGAFVPLVVAALSCLWTTGLMAICGVPPNILGPAVYILVIVYSIGSPVHFLTRYEEVIREGGGVREAVDDVLAKADAILINGRQRFPSDAWMRRAPMPSPNAQRARARG